MTVALAFDHEAASRHFSQQRPTCQSGELRFYSENSSSMVATQVVRRRVVLAPVAQIRTPS